MSGQPAYDPNSDNPRKVFVYNLPWTVDWPDLKKYFKRAGQVIYANVMKEGGPTGRSKGCGVVEFETIDEATNAISLFNGIEMEGRTIYVRRDIKDPSERTFDHTPAQKRTAPQEFGGSSSKRSRTEFSSGGGFGAGSSMRNGGASKFSGPNDMYGDAYNAGGMGMGGMGMGMGGMKSGMGMGMNAGMGLGMGMGMGDMGGAGYNGFGMRGRDMGSMGMQSGMGGYGSYNDMGVGYGDGYEYGNRQNFGIGAGAGATAQIGRRVFVANLSYETTWQQLKDHFKTVGKVTFATILKDKEGKSRGCGLVEYEQPHEALRAISKLSNSMLGDRQISVREDQKEGQEPLRNMSQPATGGFGGGRRDSQPAASYNAPVQQSMQSQSNTYQQAAMPDLPGVLPGTTNSPSGSQVVVHGLPFSYEWVHLKDMMRAAGNVAKADIVKDASGKSKGYGVVRFESEQEAMNAIEMFNNTPLHGRIIHVKRDEFA